MESKDSRSEGGGLVAVAGPGARLRAKRESLGWSVEQVAGKLRLDARYIHALEQDNHADIAAPVFVRGYLRSYAVLLQLPADAIVECYAAGDADAAALFEGPAQPQPKQRIRPAEVGWLIGAGGAVFLVAAAVILDRSVQGPPGTGQVETAAAPAPSDTSRTTAEPKAQPAQGAIAADAKTDSNSPTVAMVGGANQTSPEPLSAGAAKLVLRLSADSWVVIRDANGKALVNELMRAGSTQVLEDMKPPLQVLLGNSPAVTLEYNGKVFDQSRYSTNSVARFALGAR